MTPIADSHSSAFFDSGRADAEYVPFSPFSKWLKLRVDEHRWSRYSRGPETLSQVSREVLDRAYRIVHRSAAIDTGAIEGLYSMDRGVTYAIAAETAMWEAVLKEKGEPARSLIEAQIAAYDFILDFVTRAVPIAEAWIRELHERICAPQETYEAVTEVGTQSIPLPKGCYKTLPNHVRRRNGTIHSHAPVDLTPAEMHRLVTEVHNPIFQAAHPLLQASYTHYSFVAVHPFADGNGRVARALASVFTYRAYRIPFLVLADQKDAYLSSLEAADAGDLQCFVDFTLESCLDAINMVTTAIESAQYPRIEDTLERIQRLYLTTGGHTHEEVDGFGRLVMQGLFEELGKQRQTLLPSRISSRVALGSGTLKPVPFPNYRMQLSPQVIECELTTSAPAVAQVQERLYVYVPIDSQQDDDIVIANAKGKIGLTVRISEVAPVLKTSLKIRMRVFAEGLYAQLLGEIEVKAAETLRSQGYP
jgi:Fic family protein